ncbi:NUDIX domain-containing protein [Celeribacter indicus]|uniref:NUDIX domain-containing protein n=1 Tax=Celeribacter indicus TaxID=1208324 RepID=UPI001114F025|nr:NUDIX domain-containing protein [Celeribacter indicus]
MSDPFSALEGEYSPEEIAYLRAALAGDEPWLDAGLVALAAAEAIRYRGSRDAEALRPLRPMILIRAWSRRAARQSTRPRATELHADLTRADVELRQAELPYSGFFAVEEMRLAHRRFDGGMSGEMSRAAFLMVDAVTVLPYDPLRDRVLVIEQFRVGPLARGDAHPWMIEPIAGRIDPGEGPESTARREAVEEAGVTLGALHKIAEYYPSGGAVTEYVHSYIGIADLPDGITGVGGVDTEHEDIASMLVGFDRLMELLDAGALDVAPLYLSALWLARHRDRLRREAGV